MDFGKVNMYEDPIGIQESSVPELRESEVDVVSSGSPVSSADNHPISLGELDSHSLSLFQESHPIRNRCESVTRKVEFYFVIH